ncbi:response regulator transcription factor [Cellulosilyticum sp. I15G10I2]|uniref:response regulator transcription factor n=1 Tax=Cellulosilyticum sp. I15G10I2 TaxID=1892843 RepID=UPI00085C5E93|nr:response regulator [Cellulosilyticum sp. I15G10I2]
MYRLLIVDDEEIEREGMANYISWERFDIELVGTAWNGVEGFEKIQSEKPDIVLTDIKMPVMDGIELIRRTKSTFPSVEFVVLSGYGEYEFTSQAMEEGVRYYLLKPCSEEQIAVILDKVKKEIDIKREREQREKEYRSTVDRLLPRAKEQIFRDMLVEKEQSGKDYGIFLKEFGTEYTKVAILAFRAEAGFDYLEQFILGNVLTELLGTSHVYLFTCIQNEALFLIDERALPEIESAVERVQLEFGRISMQPMLAVVSEQGCLKDISLLYAQVQELLKIGIAEHQTGFLHYELFRKTHDCVSFLFDYGKIRETEDYGELLFELYLGFIKMNLEHYTLQEKEEICNWIVKVLYGTSLDTAYESVEAKQQSWQLLERLMNTIVRLKGMNIGKGKEGGRIKSILFATFQYIKNQELSIQFLAKEVLYMNEDYFGRLFVKNRKVKFSTYLMEQRIMLAQRLWQFDSELKVSQVAELVGYSPDGQYFSKVFRKTTETTPSEYKDIMKELSKKTTL